MQIECEFNIDQPISMPFNYNYQVQSAIYAKLRELNEFDRNGPLKSLTDFFLTFLK